LWIALAVASAGLLAWAVLPVDASRPPTLVEPTDSAAAVSLLDQAGARLQPDRITHLEVEVRQRVHFNQVSSVADGRFIQAPAGKRRLELHTQTGSREGELLVLCDGVRLTQAMRTSGAHWNEVRVVRLQELGSPPQVLAELARIPAARHWFSGDPAAMLAQLRTEVRWSAPHSVSRHGMPMVKLTGRTTQNAGPVPGGCQCRLYLDLETMWPGRLEWWDASGRRCLAEIDLRRVPDNLARSETETQGLFAFAPGSAKLIDETPLARTWLGLPPLE